MYVKSIENSLGIWYYGDMEIVSNSTIILASASPRREEILSRLNCRILVLPQLVKEVTDKILPNEIVMDLSLIKLANLPIIYPDNLCVSADTIVWLDGEQLGKPRSIDNAIEMLLKLSGKKHQVYTGYSIAYKAEVFTDYAMSEVEFFNLNVDQIKEYVKMYMPLDKAGAYGIQDGVLVKGHIGDYDNIVGFPYADFLNKVSQIKQ